MQIWPKDKPQNTTLEIGGLAVNDSPPFHICSFHRTMEMEVKAFFLGAGMGVTPATTGLGGLLSAFSSKANFLVASSHSRP